VNNGQTDISNNYITKILNNEKTTTNADAHHSNNYDHRLRWKR
jgi:hypothetical protein